MWYPIAATQDLPFRHVYHAKLLGQELAAWRADDGFVNIWENRCLHRGVRLSIGVNTGTELKCQYHGWRYANRTAGCTYIPAHPDRAPPRVIANRIFPCAERHGLIWSSLEPPAGEPGSILADAVETLVLRGIAVHAPAALVTHALAKIQTGAVVFVQPVDTANCVIRGIVAPAPAPDIRLRALRHYNHLFSAVRDDIERAAGAE